MRTTVGVLVTLLLLGGCGTTAEKQTEPPPGPRIAYATGRTLHDPTGTEADLPGKGPVSGFAPYQGSYVIVSGNALTVFGHSGAAKISSPTGSIAVSADHVAYSTADSVVIDGTLVEAKVKQLVGYVGPDLVLANTKGFPAVVGPDSAYRVKGVNYATGANEDGLLAGNLSDAETWMVMRAETGDVLWSTTTAQTGTFSPDGRYLWTVPTPVGDTTDGLRVVDATTGKPVASSKATVDAASVVWEDDTHLLATSGGKVVRISTSGDVETVPVDGSDPVFVRRP